jgi:hypothetical protein
MITKKMQKAAKKLGIALKTSEEIRKEIEDENQRQYDSTTKEQRQQFLDLMHSGEKLGKAAEKIGITSEAAAQIMLKNIREVHFLNTEAAD